MCSPLAWVGGVGGLLLPWMEGGRWLLLLFVGVMVGCGWALLVGVFVVGGFCGHRLRVLVVKGVHHWWGLVMGTCPRLCCLGVCLHLPLAGAHARACPCSCCLAACSHSLLVGARPRLCHLVGCSCPLFVGDGGGCSCLPLPSFMSPRCALPLVGPICVALLGACVCHWWGMVVGARPRLRPSLCAHPCLCGWLRVTIVACHCGCVCWWGLVRCVWDERAYHWLKDG